MNVATVIDELVTALGSISGLRVYGFVAGSIAPPTAIVGLPDNATFDLTFQRGMDQLTMPVTVLLSKADDRISTKQLANYLAGSGAKSIKAAIDGGTYTAADSVTVTSAEVTIETVGGIEYLVATFSVSVAGQGA